MIPNKPRELYRQISFHCHSFSENNGYKKPLNLLLIDHLCHWKPINHLIIQSCVFDSI